MQLASRKQLIIGLVALLFGGTSSRSEPLEDIEVAETCSYFGEELPHNVAAFTSDTEAETVIKRIVEASGLPKNFTARAAAVPNAAAMIRGRDRYILYNQYFMQKIRQDTGSDWSEVSIVAHEIGHHLSGHTLSAEGSRPKLELEADYFSGFILQKMGADLDSARLVMDRIGSDTASPTHPAKPDRLAAITNGWTKSCESDVRCNGQRTKEPNKSGQKPGSVTPTTTSANFYCCDGFGRQICLAPAGIAAIGDACQCTGGRLGTACQ